MYMYAVCVITASLERFLIMTNRALEDQLEAWKAEQRLVASQVIVKSDSDSDNDKDNLDSNDSSSNTPFKCLPKAVSVGSYYGGVDVSFPEKEGDPSVATYVIVDGNGNIVFQDYEYFDLTVPYVSSFLSFREIDPLQRLVQKQLQQKSDVTPCVILVDGNGILHARRAGIACFLGVRTGIPTVGVGKTLYCEGGLQKGLVKAGVEDMLVQLQQYGVSLEDTVSRYVLVARASIHGMPGSSSAPNNVEDVDKESILQVAANFCKGVGVKLQGSSGETLGAALIGHGGDIGVKNRTRSGTKNPIYISVGHDISLEKAVALCSELSKARIPEPVRQADLWGRELLRQKKGTGTCTL